VACPYFYPTERIEQRLWPHPWRLPLGGGFAGVCTAGEGQNLEPGETELQQWCNLGYACRRCPHFPEGPGAEAVRFAVAADEGSVIRIDFVLEKDHRPHTLGRLEFACDRGQFSEPPANHVLARQAEVYVQSYLRLTR
jgi:hypothetical protein